MTRRTIGLVGCGLWGQLVLRDLLMLAAKVVVADPDPRQLGRDLFHRPPPGVRFSRPMNFLRKSAIWPGLQETD
jgi:hypothetical protein